MLLLPSHFKLGCSQPPPPPQPYQWLGWLFKLIDTPLLFILRVEFHFSCSDFLKKNNLNTVYRGGMLCEGQKRMLDPLDLELQASVVLMAESPLQVQLM